MKKELKNLTCPNCNSSNITIRIKKENHPENKEEIIKTEPITYECTCQDCHTKYEISKGYNQYFVCQRPLPLNESKSIKLLATYNTDSPLEENYKVISINNEKEESVYLLVFENEELPVPVSKEAIDEVVVDPPKILTLYNKNK